MEEARKHKEGSSCQDKKKRQEEMRVMKGLHEKEK